MADADKGRAFLDAVAAKRPTVISPLELRGQVEGLWRAGLPSGDRTGWPSVDKYYTVVPGQLTVLTGWPGSGKSEWLDALLVNLSRQGWKFAMFSPENQPVELHLTKLCEKLCGKPFGRGPNERVAEDEIPDLLSELGKCFGFIASPSGDVISPKAVLDAAAPWLDQCQGAKRGLVIDPWNELEHWRPANLSETEYVSQTLSMLRSWARANAVHVWIVAHPQKVRREAAGDLPVPRPDMISGSQHWWNKADCAITVYRQLSEGVQDVEIHIQKVRFKHVGTIGAVMLRYDRVTGRYHELAPRLQAATVREVARPYSEVD